MPLFKKYIVVYGITIFYIAAGLTLGEFHPFSKFPMYNQLPNWSYIFYYTDENNTIIPCDTFNFSGAALGHLYYNIAESKNIKFGNGMESDDELEEIGRLMYIETTKQSKYLNNIKTVKLWRKYFYFEREEIKVKEKLIYEKINT
jgi:hypothetical protein